MIIFLLVILVLLILFALRPRKRKPPLVDMVETVTPDVFGRLRGSWRSWRGAMTTQPSSATQQLQTWATQNLAEASPLREWLLALTWDEMLSVSARLNTFCSDLGFELDWLFDPVLQDNLELSSVMTEIVTAYCTAVWRAVLVRDDIHAYKSLLAFEKQPEDRKNREFGQHLYAQMVAIGFAPVMPPELALAAAEERDTYVLAAIHQVAQQDPVVFKQTLREVIRELDKMA